MYSMYYLQHFSFICTWRVLRKKLDHSSKTLSLVFFLNFSEVLLYFSLFLSAPFIAVGDGRHICCDRDVFCTVLGRAVSKGMCAKVLDIVAGSLIARFLPVAKVLIGWEEKCMG